MECPKVRCVNIDWLEVYANEDNQRFPCDAEYFRRQGYFITQREYGTRTYSEMFTIQDEHGDAWIEVRRNPMSGNSKFTGLTEKSCHLRMVNRKCYQDNPIRDLAEFMIKHDYIFISLHRIDICYDFRVFDSGDDVARFLRRYIECKFSKVNQTKVRAIGDDNWGAFAWESISWGAKKSMVSTKIYNKTKELSATGNKKPWIVQAWLETGLIDDIYNVPTVWRLEFSLTSKIKNYILLKKWNGHSIKEERVPHTPAMFDGREKLWQRFEELAFHYFHFKYVEYKDQPNSEGEKELLRKDLCKEKKLFDFNMNRNFYTIENPARESKIDTLEQRLKRYLEKWTELQYTPNLKNAAYTILNVIDTREIKRYTKHGTYPEIEALRLAIKMRTGWDYQRVIETADEIMKLIKEKEIW